MKDLSDVNESLYDEIVLNVESGNRLSSSKSYESALKVYATALEMLPEPKNKWELYHWIAKCNCHAHLGLKDHISAKEWAHKAAETKPPRDTYSLILLGVCLIETNEKELAYESLKKAFDMGGNRAFQAVERKYLDFVNCYDK